MAEITAALVKDLRERTGAGMMDCKRALGETGGDIEAAVDHLRKKGLAAAAKKAGRQTSEGLVGLVIEGRTGALENACALAHKLHGTAGAYGFGLVSAAAGRLEEGLGSVRRGALDWNALQAALQEVASVAARVTLAQGAGAPSMDFSMGAPGLGAV